MIGMAVARSVACASVLSFAAVGCFSPNDSSQMAHPSECQSQRASISVPLGAHEQVAVRARHPETIEDVRLLRMKSESGWSNENALRDFALKESPKLWQTVQTIRAGVAARRNSLRLLEADLKEFSVSPETDTDYRRLCGEIDSLLDSLAIIFGNLEEAYVAHKKLELMSSDSDGRAIVEQAQDNCAKAADFMTKRYCEMSNAKRENYNE